MFLKINILIIEVNNNLNYRGIFLFVKSLQWKKFRN
jgi:hypothetical protein